MKKNILVLIFLAVASLLTGCIKDRCYEERYVTRQTPVYKTYDEIRTPVAMEAAHDLINPGKIYTYGVYLLVCEWNEGIHLIDNTNPSAPLSLAFIKIPGCTDMAMKNGILYVNNYTDLLALEIISATAIKEVFRGQNFFKPIAQDAGNGVLVGYNYKEELEKIDCENLTNSFFFEGDVIAVNDVAMGAGAGSADGRNNSTGGQAGSMASMVLDGSFIYAINHDNTIVTINLEAGAQPIVVGETTVSADIETLFPYKDKLFIGSTTGMFIYEKMGNGQFKYLSQFMPLTACDPVVANDKYAYVTIHNGTVCGSALNLLYVIDIEDIFNPKELAQLNLTHPMGMALTENQLYVCDSQDGVRIIDIANPSTPVISGTASGLAAYDAIAVNNSKLLIVSGTDGIYQYDRSNPTFLTQLSKIAKK